MLQWSYGCGYGLDTGGTSESYRTTGEVLFASPGPAMVSTSSRGMMMPIPITSGSQVLMEFRIQH